MNQHVKTILERVATWPEEAQEELARMALAIEEKHLARPAEPRKPSLREVMVSSPLSDVEFDRVTVRVSVRDVVL